MATITKTFAIALDGMIRGEYDYDDLTLRLIALRVVSAMPKPCRVIVSHVETLRTIDRDFPTGTTEVVAPTAANARLTFTRDAVRDRLNGITINLLYPAA